MTFRRLIIGLAAWGWICLLLSLHATTYYVATNGSSGNNGLSVGAPWPIDYAMTHISVSNTVEVASGVYTNQVIIRKSDTVLHSTVKWGARIVGSSFVTGSQLSIWPPPIQRVTVDGFEVANSWGPGVIIYGTNCIIRNCWVHNSGQGHTSNFGSGIFSDLPHNGTLIEYCLLENNGWSDGFDHGAYISGTNVIFRNNVCRYNRGFGLSVYDNHGGASDKVLVYGNLMYSNFGDNFNNGHQLGFNSLNVAGTTNYAYGNTLYTPLANTIFVEWTTLYCSNNIILSTGDGFNLFSPSGTHQWAFGDYNLAPRTLLTAGTHDVLTNYSGFVSTNTGLYWLTADSPARGGAIQNRDIGAFQYSYALQQDHRVLDPSPQSGADYWSIPPIALTNLRISKAY